MPARSCRAAFEAFEAWQTAGLNALNNTGQWPECLAEGKVVASQQKQAPHLRWSQAPPLPWRRPGSADIVCNIIYIYNIYIYIYIYLFTLSDRPCGCQALTRDGIISTSGDYLDFPPSANMEYYCLVLSSWSDSSPTFVDYTLVFVGQFFYCLLSHQSQTMHLSMIQDIIFPHLPGEGC